MTIAGTIDTVCLIRFQKKADSYTSPQISEYHFKRIIVNPPPIDEDTRYILAMAASSPSFDFLKGEE